MDFGKILDKWEKENTGAEGKKPTAPKTGTAASRDEKNDEVPQRSSHPLNAWLARNGTYDKDAAFPGDNKALRERNAGGERRHKLLRKKPDAVIDLHGLSADDAWAVLETFFENSRENGHEKLLVIHGKGNHRNTDYRDFIPARSGGGRFDGGNGSVLKELTRRFIEHCSYAGESGHSTSREGGTGSTWVILKERS